MKNKSQYLVYLTVIVGLIGLAGCATTGSAVQNTQNEIGYEKFYDSYGDYKLVGRNNDIYLEKLDGSESRRITSTQDKIERYAYFVSNGKGIIYEEVSGKYYPYDEYRYFYIDRDKDDNSRKEISQKEFSNLFNDKK
jgi:hypothetical protein